MCTAQRPASPLRSPSWQLSSPPWSVSDHAGQAAKTRDGKVAGN